MKRVLLFFAIYFFACALVFPQADGIRRYVAVHKAPLKESANFFAKDLGSLSLGDTVTLVREGSKWTQVRAGAITGWVLSSSLSVRRIVSSGSNAVATEIALAGKGFSSEMEMEYRESGLDYSIVDMMENTLIGAEELFKFISEGHLARGQ
jgi:hypothetical protein